MVDFNRNVYCLFGMPLDAVSTPEAAAMLEQAKTSGHQCFLSTPNLNYVIASLGDSEFRNSVCRSDLSVADGMPLIWVARLIGVPITERVSGSGLFDYLRRRSALKWSAFFFGGPEGVGRQACDVLAADASMRPAGFIYPGFGTVEQMSRPDWIEQINDSGADIVVVSLGSAKGQAWICRNLAQLTVPVLSHLGAVINFVAGTVNRAPQWMQRSGTEWLWRLKEEPRLWRRYLGDGLALLRLLFTQVLPLAVNQRTAAVAGTEYARAQIGNVSGIENGEVSLHGAWAASNLGPVRAEFARLLDRGGDATLDLSDLTGFDSAFVALLLLLDIAMSDAGFSLHLKSVSGRNRRLLRLHGVHELKFV